MSKVGVSTNEHERRMDRLVHMNRDGDDIDPISNCT